LRLGLAAGLPIGRDELYPFSDVGLLLRADLHKDLRPVPGWWLGLTAGGVAHLESSGDQLGPAAFPDGWHAAGELALRLGPRRSLVFAFDHANREGRVSDRVRVELWWPSGSRHSVGLLFDRELADARNRPAQTSLGVVLRLASAPAAPAEGETPPPAAGRATTTTVAEP
jgi:hypothetical protein